MQGIVMDLDSRVGHKAPSGFPKVSLGKVPSRGVAHIKAEDPATILFSQAKFCHFTLSITFEMSAV